MRRPFKCSSLVASLFVAGLLLVGCSESEPQQKILPGSPEDTPENAIKNYDFKKLSYALGISAGQYIVSEEIRLREDEFMRGLRDQLNGKPELSDAEVQDVMRSYAMMHMNAKAAEAGRAEKRYFDSVAQLEGVIKDESGLCYKILQDGNGAQPQDTSMVLMHYKVTTVDGKQIDASAEEPVMLDLRRVIRGWSIAIPKLKEGAKATLYIPSELAYGPSGRDPIPANATLIFDVELVKVMSPADVEAYTKKMSQRTNEKK